jgi:apolipoprotein N-acyltransferase
MVIHNKIILLILCICSACLQFLSFPTYDLSFLIWVGFAPFLITLQGKKPWQGFLLGWITGVLFFLGITTWWLKEFKTVSIFASGLGYLYLGFYFGILSFLVTLIRRRTSLPFLIAAPIWVFVEYLRSNLSFLAFPWALLAQAQHQNIPMIQMASVAGIYGVSFLVMLVNAAVADFVVHVFSPSPQPSPARGEGVKKNGLLRRGESREDGFSGCWIPKGLQKWVAHSNATIVRLGVIVLIVGGIWIWGWASLPSKPSGKPLSVAVVQGNIPQKIKWDRTYRDFIISRHEALTRQAAQTRPDLIVWPETATPGLILKDISLYNQIVSLTRESKSHFIIGSSEYPKFARSSSKGSQVGNSAIYILPSGRIIGQYLKIRLLPFGEYIPLKDYITWPKFILPADKRNFDFPGKEFVLFPIGSVKAGSLICWEIMFPEMARQAIGRGADFLVNLSNEAWFGKTDFPSLMLSNCVFRAVENRTNLIRATNTGISCFIDSYGRVTGRVTKDGRDSFVEGTLTQTIYVNRPGTFYTRYGDILVYLSAAFTFIVLVYSFWKPKHRKQIA